MEIYDRSDLACEFFGSVSEAPEGTFLQSERIGGLKVDRLKITTERAAERLGRPIGRYVTFKGPSLHLLSEADEERMIRMLAGELRGMTVQLFHKVPDAAFSVFVVGLGNNELTADAIGPQTVRRLSATRHLQKEAGELYQKLDCCALSTFAPGVLGQTGVESADLVRGAVSLIKPDLVLVIDSLTARSCEHLASTVQIGNVGICPGSGVGNHRAAIDRESLGIPVISMGIPTVVRSSTLVYDALHRAGLGDFSPELATVLKGGSDFFVSPKECDCVLHAGVRILSRSISMAFTERLTDWGR